MLIRMHHCEAPDSWVDPKNKLANGKGGNGEARLFTSSSREIQAALIEKPWRISFGPTYIDDIRPFMDDNSNFIRGQNGNRMDIIERNISELSGQIIHLKPQDGEKDVRRYYVGVKYIDDPENKAKWYLLRRCIAPTLTTLEFYANEGEDCIDVRVVHNKNVKKYNVPTGCSYASLEWLKYVEETEGIELQHAMNGGEHKERMPNGYFAGVDGYHSCEKHKCSGTKENPCKWDKTVFEFQGDYWHRNKQEKDKVKRKKYEELGYKVVVMWEHEWINLKKIMKGIA